MAESGEGIKPEQSGVEPLEGGIKITKKWSELDPSTLGKAEQPVKTTQEGLAKGLWQEGLKDTNPVKLNKLDIKNLYNESVVRILMLANAFNIMGKVLKFPCRYISVFLCLISPTFLGRQPFPPMFIS
jgi:hypothetical protein